IGKNDCPVVFGDPICSKDNKPRLAKAFHNFCSEKKWNVIYVMATEWFATWARHNLCCILMGGAEEFFFDPRNDPTQNSKNHKLRNKIRHTKNAGLTVHEYSAKENNHDLEQ